MVPKWEKIPETMKNKYVKKYYDILISKKDSLILKRIFDVMVSLILLVVLLPLILIISVLIKLDSKGEIIYKQTRVTQYGREFCIFKFRTMRKDPKITSLITYENDPRVTKIGSFLRKFRLDEIPQLINVLTGDMSFVGARPEVKKYVDLYTDEMLATLILPAGVTSICSIRFRDEEKYFKNSDNIFETYVNCVWPKKMIYNIEYLENFSFLNDIKIMFLTFFEVFLR